jgi:WD40 repeat protein
MTGHHGSISSMVLSKDGTRFASASLDEEINIWKIYYEGKITLIVRNLSEIISSKEMQFGTNNFK